MDDESSREDLIDLVENLSIISDTDKIKCPSTKGHVKYVKACLVNCPKIANKLTRCRAISIFIDTLLKRMLHPEDESTYKLSPGGKTKGDSLMLEEEPHILMTIEGKSGKLGKSIIGKGKVAEKLYKNTNKSIKKNKK